MFKPLHIGFMVFTAAAVFYISLKLKNSPTDYIEKFLKISALIMLLFDPIYWAWEYINFGKLELSTTLPLYICSLFWILLPFAAFSKNELVKRIAMSNICTVGAIGGILGIFFNVYLDRYPFFSFVPIRSLLYHFMMILVVSVLWSSKYYTPQIKDTFLCFVPVLTLLVPCIAANAMFGWDYCYTNGGKGTPLEILSKSMPKGAFLFLLYATMFVVINIVFYLPTITRAIKSNDAENCEISAEA